MSEAGKTRVSQKKRTPSSYLSSDYYSGHIREYIWVKVLSPIRMNKVILEKWLKCGFVFNKQLFSIEEGTPQGDIISPTLANMTLDGLQKILADNLIST